MTQLPLFPENNPLNELDERVRTTEIGGEIYASILDIMQYHGDKVNPRTAWNTTLSNLEKQGYRSSTEFVQHQFRGRGQRPTPVINLNEFLRIVQATEIKEWESIRAWLAKTGTDVIKAQAAQNREHQIALLQDNNLADTYEGRRYIARHENIETLKELNKIIAKVCDNPNFGALTNERYEVLFGETIDQIKAVLRTQKIRDSLHLTQIRTLTFAEDTLKDALSQRNGLSNQDIKIIIQTVLPPIGDMLKELMMAQGLHHITGKPLLERGE